jgi:hypothetical protein
MHDFSDFVVYVDESGNTSVTGIDPEYPLFVLTFCVFRKDEYVNSVVPALQLLKFAFFGHDMVVFHEREIRLREPPFDFRGDRGQRDRFLGKVTEWVRDSPFTIIAIVLDKRRFVARYGADAEPYGVAMREGLDRVHECLKRCGNGEKQTHIVFEARGRKEDRELELEIRRVCAGNNRLGEPLPFEIVFPSKQINSTGLQLADLTARPLGRYCLDRKQANRAYEVIAGKLFRDGDGRLENHGLVVDP